MPESVVLDLMELDGKLTPGAMVDEIVRQNPNLPLPVPLEKMAEIAGIESIGELTTEGFEGMLITNPEKSKGVILVKAGNNPRRRRFTIGHELGHYLLPLHRQERFSCKTADIKDTGDGNERSGILPTIEVEANAFASELLMPRVEFKKRLQQFGEPDLAHLIELNTLFDASVEATVWRYKALSDYPVAFVFSHNNVVRYWTKGIEFPYYLRVRKGHELPKESQSRDTGDGVSEWNEVDSDLWLEESREKRHPDSVLEQTLYQLDGYKVTLIYVEDVPDEDEEED